MRLRFYFCGYSVFRKPQIPFEIPFNNLILAQNTYRNSYQFDQFYILYTIKIQWLPPHLKYQTNPLKREHCLFHGGTFENSVQFCIKHNMIVMQHHQQNTRPIEVLWSLFLGHRNFVCVQQFAFKCENVSSVIRI